MKENLSFTEQLLYYNKMAMEFSKKNNSEDLTKELTSQVVPAKAEDETIIVSNNNVAEKKESKIASVSVEKKETKQESSSKQKTKTKPLTYEERIREQFGFGSKGIKQQKDEAAAVLANESVNIAVTSDEFIPRFPDVDRDSFDYPFDKPDKNDIYSQFNDDTDFNLYQQFLRQNPKEGRFRARVFTGRGSVPIEGATVTISKVFGDSKFIFDTLKSDSSGLTPVIDLPAPSKDLSQSPESEKLPYALYNVEVDADGFNKITFRDVAIYEDMLATQQAYMTATANRPQIIVTEKQPNL